MKNSLALFLLIVSWTAQAQKPKEYGQAVSDLVEKIEQAHGTSSPMRIAVVPFLSAIKAETAKNFGEYLTESITGKLAEKPQAFKVFERTRLDAIFKENELMLGGMMKPSEALKIGQLLPIDALFSGTYTKLKTYVEVSGRLIDVTSGEILTSYSGRIKLSKNIKALFDSPASVPPISASPNQVGNITIINQIGNGNVSSGKSKEEICKEKGEAFRSRLEDLSTDEKINTAVKEATKTPFDNTCGQLHFNFIYSLTRFHLYPSEYKKFLTATLDTISFPTQDDRAYEIVRYWADDKQIDQEEWRSGFSALKKVGNYTLSSYIGYLIGRVEDPMPALTDRIKQVMTIAESQKLGLPRPISYNDAFFEMMEGLDKNQDLRLFVYENYSSKLTVDAKSAPKIYSRLNSMYREEEQPAEKKKILNWIIAFFDNYSFEKSHEELYEFAFSFQLTSNESTNERIRKEYPADDLPILIRQCQSKFTEYALLTPYNSQKEDRINFCAQHGIPIPGVIPSATETEAVLKGSNLDEQLRVMKLLTQMNAVPSNLEATLIALLDKRSLEEKEKMTEIQSLAVSTLGKLHTSNLKAIDHMVQMVTSYNYNESDRAKAALIDVGKPAVQPLIKKLQSTDEQDGGLRYQIILILGKIGKDAKPAEAVLQNLLQKTTNSDVRYIIEATLQSIK